MTIIPAMVSAIPRSQLLKYFTKPKTEATIKPIAVVATKASGPFLVANANTAKAIGKQMYLDIYI